MREFETQKVGVIEKQRQLLEEIHKLEGTLATYETLETTDKGAIRIQLMELNRIYGE